MKLRYTLEELAVWIFASVWMAWFFIAGALLYVFFPEEDIRFP